MRHTSIRIFPSRICEEYSKAGRSMRSLRRALRRYVLKGIHSDRCAAVTIFRYYRKRGTHAPVCGSMTQRRKITCMNIRIGRCGSSSSLTAPDKMTGTSFVESVTSSPPPPNSITIYIDADACPVKQEIYRVAERQRRRNMDTFANSSVSVATADNTTRRGPAVCRAAAEEDCRMSRTSHRSDQRTHRYHHCCARGPCCSATARG